MWWGLIDVPNLLVASLFPLFKDSELLPLLLLVLPAKMSEIRKDGRVMLGKLVAIVFPGVETVDDLVFVVKEIGDVVDVGLLMVVLPPPPPLLLLLLLPPPPPPLALFLFPKLLFLLLLRFVCVVGDVKLLTAAGL